jgi:hypothetical protein
MAKAAIFLIVFGATFFALGMLPDLIDTFFEGFRNVRANFSPTRRPIHDIQTDSAQIWLLVGGGVMIIVGLLAILLR